ncbi:SMP-30/gluconolactonase/LRE family protein [Acidovorax sp. NCPPB 4044]|uniref:SMP-30/gluconolactonase/LRE family protein n=1 Tax=Acidovorax sp. NCPPB 4044 TaxID=2940490 RepID=UPI0023031321|nr:SMP-30/gluconolactonase/LRE family protein [Acidovorax sp. NCPPB 4044]MDA8520160.1 SMP-30/gluconolactonase/LRE family protein [Acidovorax sp. NCPPB 4044]
MAPLFAAPPRGVATVFARLPDELRNATAESGWNALQPSGLAAPSFLEGPSFDRDGTLWCVDVVNGRLLTVDERGEFHVELAYEGWPNGLKIHRDGRVFVADHQHGIMVYDRERRRITPLLERWRVERFKAINDLFFARNGDLYFTDQGLTGLHDPTGRLFRLRADGQLDCLLDNVPSPNGLVMDREERTLFLAVTRENAVWRVPLDRQGLPTKVGRFLQLSGGVGPDGLALDTGDGLWVAHAGLGCLWRFSAEGEPLQRIDAPVGKLTTNLAFAPGTADIFVTESTTATILHASVECCGQSMFSHG